MAQDTEGREGGRGGKCVVDKGIESVQGREGEREGDAERWREER